jgi:putative transcriptional regulator
MVESSSTAGWSPVFGRVGLLNLGGEESVPLDDVSRFRLFGGYSGWGAGQLDAELAEEAWFVVDAAEADPFSDDPESLWRTVLRRQPGKLAMFAYFPDDLKVN